MRCYHSWHFIRATAAGMRASHSEQEELLCRLMTAIHYDSNMKSTTRELQNHNNHKSSDADSNFI